ncbi:hypothetical protein [Streptomyces sp. WMMC897]|uniref:hypothetical protein n=1 Tax=Streptomyces sp. WMMC897 TaxID=3014782 RepID=UPI0022B66352|nr:hypothetical protein [Streptomyces sp. WMMC897]MCZ7417286.1 hypothetical protein [Streptomyces sp. WMMC897]
MTLTDALVAVHLDNQRRLLAGLDEDDQVHLADLLRRLTATLPPDNGTPPP